MMHRNQTLEPKAHDGHIETIKAGRVAWSNRTRDKEVSRMRRIVSLGLLLAMAGCGRYAGSPFDGFGGFIGDTHNIYANPNRPVGDSDNMRRALGQPATSEPLAPEPGNVWPGPIPPDRTLGDIARDPNETLKPGDEMNLGRPLGSSTPPGSTQPGAQPLPSSPNPSPALPDHQQPRPGPGDTTILTPSGPGVINNGGSVRTYTDPRGTTGIVVPNGNGTSTLVAPDGSVQTVPSPR